MNYYEHTYIASQGLNNKDLSDLHQKIEDLIKKNKGKIEKKENWGLRQLAYPIKNLKKGYYANLYFSGEPAVVQELEKIERIDSNILRFMTIRIKNIPEENSELLQKEESK
ncbi:MAG: 30S ribosomal protein S6 [Candidatus Fonsibacter sp.]|nr:30S ribosomal protein S6 [Candidatus Fonsibacter sp.]